jgi:hypothetical protein
MYKTIIVLNEEYTQNLPVIVNAVGHVAQSVGAQLATFDHARFAEYVDAGGHKYPSISWWPVIILKGRPSKIWAYLDALEQQGAPRAAFLSTMIEDGSDIQLARTAGLRRDQLGIVALAGFGKADALAPLTKRFSLWRGPTLGVGCSDTAVI